MDYKPKCKVKIIKLLEENIEENLSNLGFGGEFLYTTKRSKK